MLLAYVLAIQAAAPWPLTITSALAITGVSLGGRRPIPEDAIMDQIATGKWHSPVAGDTVQFRGHTSTWKSISANKDGWFEGRELNNGYVFAHLQATTTGLNLLSAQGDALVYVNGSPRGGDPYSTGNVNLPIELRAGDNELLFVTGRGRLKAVIAPAPKPVFLQAEDTTAPDVLTTDRKPLWGSIIAINAQAEAQKGLRLRCSLPDGRALETRAPEIPPLTVRKLPFRIPVPVTAVPGELAITVTLIGDGKALDQRTLKLTVRQPLEIHTRTFISGVDGSVQYYAVNPATKASPNNALVLTLHGASVEAIGQARAYGQKEWASIVAPTNRRPYGFDWEDIGRLDALEVLNLAKQTIPYDPTMVDLVGHSMGGHGTWAVGTLYPNLFASIAPSAGWISFWSYGGGWSPYRSSSTEMLLRKSINVSDTLGRIRNTLAERMYVLHGDADDNVPVSEARTGKAALEHIGHSHFEYHEQPGAGHWWGNQCVDWPPLFDMIRAARLDSWPRTVDFTTQNPAVSSELGWVRILQQTKCLEPSHVVASRSLDGRDVIVRTENVESLELSKLPDGTHVSIDSESISPSANELRLTRAQDRWHIDSWIDGKAKSPERSGPFKQVFDRRFVLVIGSKGSIEENRWASDKARFDAETFLVRGNGAVDCVFDSEFAPSKYRGRNVLLYGNSQTNSAWKTLLGSCPIKVSEGEVLADGRNYRSYEIGGLLLYPNPGNSGCLVGAFTGTGLKGMRRTDRLPIFTSGVAYPDWILLDSNSPNQILGDGFFDNHWRLDAAQSAWNAAAK